MKLILFFLIITLQTIAQARASLLVVTEDLPPLNYVENNIIKGHHTYLVKELLKLADLKYSMAILPWARSYQIAQTQPNVLIYTINHTQSRHDKFQWITEFPTKLNINYYALASSNFKNLTLTELKSLRIGTEYNTANDDYITRNGFSNITRVSHIQQTIGMLKRNRIDIVIASPGQIKEASIKKGMNFSQLSNLGTAFTGKPSIAVSLSTPRSTVKKLKEAYIKLSQTVELCTLMKIDKPLCTL